MRNTNLTYFIFGALTYQVFFIFFKSALFDAEPKFLRENAAVRKNIPCPQKQAVHARHKRETEEESKTIKLAKLDPIDFSEYALKRARVKFYLERAYNPRNESNGKWYGTKPLFLREECRCNRPENFGKSYNYQRMFSEEINQKYTTENEIRKEQYSNFLKDNRFSEMAYPMIRRTPFNPIEVPVFGLTVHPYESIIIPIKFHLEESEMIQFDVDCRFCVWGFDPARRWRNVTDANKLTKKIRLFVEEYDARPLIDIVVVTMKRQLTGEEFEARFPVTYKTMPMPILTTRSTNKFHDMVTIVTKTFMRYPCLERLLDSINKFYPGTQVIVADDTPTEHYKKLDTFKYPFVKQHKMPANAGFFAGRALAISQVMTEYFITMDDDFLVTEETKLEELLKIIDESGYDIIGGGVARNNDEKQTWDKMGRFDIKRDEYGFCYYRGAFQIRPPPSLPGCRTRDIVKNYFIGRVATTGTVRMDPHFARTGHKEFFLDALGELRIASCDGVAPVLHDPEGCDGRSEEYSKFRFPERSEEEQTEYRFQNDKLWYHRNYLKCYQEQYPSTI
ncbi:Oidioi.mRNA.OKI2018_I69.PAR.g8917.t1.cds [Oikopleura dioica]|uniref:Oidioi.mRNA.OKI2018_I69.PAR.g8917.t1.cds n=1 Tax=Oikopleura dioica TaxID=34765 RepID=A0ABN7RI57_OIKDI|nr:Oidioi.mRNA.OKI2018_I69.PAR.g8917.t1.cds [Oikopleura dioica]